LLLSVITETDSGIELNGAASLISSKLQVTAHFMEINRNSSAIIRTEIVQQQILDVRSV
jgi:hypothetical protein